MTRFARITALGLLLVPFLLACGKTSARPTTSLLYASSVTLADVTPVTGDAENWWVAAPTFDVPPLNSATRDEADVDGLTVRFTHLGTEELLSVHYRVWSTTSIATNVESNAEAALGTSLTGPAAGDKVLYYNQKLAAGGATFVNVAYVRVGQTIISVLWTRGRSYASTKDFGRIVVKAANRLKDGEAGKLHPSPSAKPDPLLLAPPNSFLTLLGSASLPIEVVPPLVGQPNPAALVSDFHRLGATTFVFGDYALNLDTHMEVITAGIHFRGPTAGAEWVSHYFAIDTPTATGEYGGWDGASGQYLFAFGSGSNAILVLCKSSAAGEEAGRACEAPLAALIPAWHQQLGP